MLHYTRYEASETDPRQMRSEELRRLFWLGVFALARRASRPARPGAAAAGAGGHTAGQSRAQRPSRFAAALVGEPLASAK